MNKKSNFDWGLLFAAISISSLGILMLVSVASNLFVSQIFFVLIGLLFFLIFSFLDIDIYSSFKNIGYVAIILILILTFIVGEEVRGSIRWIKLGGVNIQISEFAKPFLIIIASFIFAKDENKWKKLSKGFLLFFPVLLMIYKQPDLGNVLIYLSIFAGLILASGYLNVIIITVVIAGILMPFLWNFLHDYQKNRIITFMNPGIDPQGTGYNALQATIAVGSGGIFGKGFGQGTQSHLNFLPEHHTDFIFASFAEEFGFFGSIILIGLYTFLLIRILNTAVKSKSKEGSLISLGIFTMFFVQILINIGMNIGLLPITGITLPLFSYGGSSIITSFISLGIVEALYKKTEEDSVLKIK